MSMINPVPQAVTDKIKIHIEEPLAGFYFGNELSRRLKKHQIGPERPVILVCIGTDRSTGDCLGPLTGSKLAALLAVSRQNFFHIYGTLDQPVHATNLKDKLEEIQKKFKNPFIIAIDACLGNLDSIGCITIGDGPLKPGAGVNKKLPPIGHIYVTGIVNVSGFMEYLVLQNTRLNLVMRIADTMVEGFHGTITRYMREEIKEI